MATQLITDSTPLDSAGTWHVDPAAGKVSFTVRTTWGLSKVRGSFSRYRGTLTTRPHGTAGELVIEAASLDTGNSKRDAHLRSDDFFDVERHPQIVFTSSSVRPAPDGVAVSGELRIGDRSIVVDVPVEIVPNGDRMLLHGELSVPREHAGLHWNKLGMIRGDAQLDIELELFRA